eukprot:4467525-Alexandrium_andersonii.AAC.1
MDQLTRSFLTLSARNALRTSFRGAHAQRRACQASLSTRQRLGVPHYAVPFAPLTCAVLGD